MKRKILILALMVIVPISCLVWAASSVTETWSRPASDVDVVNLSWIADATTGVFTTYEIKRGLDGWIAMVVTNPGDTAPLANYDIAIKDSDGVDIMGGSLSNRSATATEQAVPTLMSGAYGPRFVEGLITVEISGTTVAAATGEIIIYISR